MKSSTIALQKELESEPIQTRIEALNSSHSSTSSGETTVAEAYQGYKDLRELILDSIKKGIYEEVPYVRRNHINSHVSQIHNYAGNPVQFINHFNALDDQIQLSGLWQRNAEDLDAAGQVKDIMRLQRKMTKLKGEVSEIESIGSELRKLLESSKELSKDHQDLLEKEKESSDSVSKINLKTNSLYETIKKNEQEIENKKKNILAFHSNIEDDKNTLQKLFSDLTGKVSTELNDRISRAKELIEEAENALELKSTQGISRAYGERLTKLNKDWSKYTWLIGAGFFLAVTMILGLMLTGFTIGTWSWGGTDNEAVIFGRIAMTGIGITAAVFCAKRYLYIKNLEEDYEYKVVLTKSILAFAGKIGEIDPNRVAEYLNRVLLDLHQDPSKRNVHDKVIDNEILQTLKKLMKNGKS